MAWPQTVDYNEAIQNPQGCFGDGDLARGQAAEGMMPGIPLSYAGNFATVYKITTASGVWAVKCFTRKVDNLQVRYQAISEHLKRHKRRFAVDFQYLEEGIRIKDLWYPVVKMQWVEGFTLNEFLRERVSNTALLEQMCALWLRLGNEMHEVHLAHGDLQHGNVMLVPGSSASSLLLRLVDYDGMWIPALEGCAPGEVGHANYQHPERLKEGGYSADIDRFAQLAIFTALRCLMVGGKPLWIAHDNEENILFREADFKSPVQSKLFPKLLALPDTNVSALAGHLLTATQRPLDQVPPLCELVSENSIMPLSRQQIDQIQQQFPSVKLPGAPTVPLVPIPPVLPVSMVDWRHGPAPLPPPLPPTLPLPPQPPGAKRMPRAPSAPVLDLPVALPAHPTAIPMQAGRQGSAGPAPVAILMPPLPATLLEPLPADAPKKSPGNSTRLPKGVVLPPPPPSAPAPLLPPPPSPKAPPFPKLPSRTRSGDSLARLWPLALGVVVVPLLILAVWLMWPADQPTPPQAEKPHLLPMEPIALRAGHSQEVVFSIARPTTDEELEVRIAGLPEEVSCDKGKLAVGDPSGQVRVRLNARPDAPAFNRKVSVRLLHDGEKLDEKLIDLTVTPFKPPRLRDRNTSLSLRLQTGEKLLVTAPVIAQDNTDPWTLKFDSLPKGLTQAVPAAGVVPAGFAGVELVAAADAPAGVCIIKVLLLADGVPADETSASLEVKSAGDKLGGEKPPAPVDISIGVSLPARIVLPLGEKARFTARLSRNGYTGPLRLTVEDLPMGVTADPVDVAASEDAPVIELKADAAERPRIAMQQMRVAAWVDGKEVGSQKGTFFLMQAAGAGMKPDEPGIPRILQRPQGVQFQTCDGVTLHGTLYPGSLGRNGATVLMVPEPSTGYSAKDKSWVALALALQKQGCTVLTFDFRGFGENARSADSLASSFWTFKVNKDLLALLQKKGPAFPGIRGRPPRRMPGAVGAPTTLDGALFPDKYIPWLVQDIVAARCFLDTRHDQGTLNSQNLVVIGAGEGATLSAFWYVSECHRHKTDVLKLLVAPQPPFANEDIIGAVWLDAHITLGKLNIAAPLALVRKQLQTEKTLPPMLFVYDKKATGAELRNRAMMGNWHQKADAEKAIEGTGESGQALLGDGEADKAVMAFVTDLLEKHKLRVWAPRLFVASNYTWYLNGKNHFAKSSFTAAPQALPLDLLGFKYLPAR